MGQSSLRFMAFCRTNFLILGSLILLPVWFMN